jgi:8-oxo-dGTP pyrophosphatase MutT (NUDIX family)
MIESGGKGGRNRQVAALCYRTSPRVEILLVTSRETRRWVTPKGWPMRDRTDPEAAAREAFEEAGVLGSVAEEPFGAFGYDKTLKSGEARTISAALYPLLVEQELPDWPERKQRARVWFTPSEAAAAVREEDLAELIRDFADLHRPRGWRTWRVVRLWQRLTGVEYSTNPQDQVRR